MTYQSVTLKVCEGCGTLWVRRGSLSSVYCNPCADLLKEFPDPQTRRRLGRPKKDRSLPGQALGALALAGGAQ